MPVVPWEGAPATRGPPTNCQFLPRCVDIRWRLKKGHQLLGRRKVHPERENPGYTYEKRASALRWYGASQMVNRALKISQCKSHMTIISNLSHKMQHWVSLWKQRLSRSTWLELMLRQWQQRRRALAACTANSVFSSNHCFRWVT